MLFSQFEHRFPAEDSCIDYFKDIRMNLLGECPKLTVRGTIVFVANKHLNVNSATISYL